MFNFALLGTEVAAYRRPAYRLLSAAILLTAAVSAQASNTDAHFHTIEPSSHACHSDVKTQASPPQYQSTHQSDMGCILTQLQTYQQKVMTPRQQYFAYKAQAWLNYAHDEASSPSRSLAAGEYALQSAGTILQALKNGTDNDLSLTTNIPSTSALMRPDLWATLSALKDRGGIANAPRELSLSEVALMRAAADYCEHGSPQSANYFLMADRWLEQAREAYVNAHDSQTNVALENLIVRYYEHYVPLDAGDDVCRGQVLPSIHQ